MLATTREGLKAWVFSTKVLSLTLFVHFPAEPEAAAQQARAFLPASRLVLPSDGKQLQ